jgi:trigger factor
MQVTETSADGLKREYTITVPAGDLEQEINRRLGEIGRQVRLPGFRPGKVPMQILRTRFGPSVRGEVLQSTLQASSAEAISERQLRPALPPKVDILSAGEGADLEYKMAVEVLPEIPEPSFADLDIERLVVEVQDEEVDRAVGRIAEQQRKSEVVERPAESGDILLVDTEGRIGEQEIPGAGSKDRQIVLGAGSSIPGFEDQLVGATAGEHRKVRVTFPTDYAVADLAGKDADFDVDVKEVRRRLPIAIDDKLGQAVGLENLAELRQELRQRLQRDYDAASRLRLKRALLDKLAQGYDFPVPPGMVDLEFDNIWRQYEAQKVLPPAVADADAMPAGETGADAMPAAGEADADAMPAAGEADADAMPAAGKADADAMPAAPAPGMSQSDEAAKGEYRRIAERRVRLGLLLAEVGRRNNITVGPDEVNQAIAREARRHPGHERQVIDFYRQNPGTIDTLRAPIFEDKVIDFIVELAKIGERKVTPQELLGESEPEEDALAS